MKSISKIMEDYTSARADLEQTNAALKAAKAGFSLEVGKNTLTEAERRATTIGCYPDMANGFGLLDTGTGSLDKVQVRKGSLVDGDCGGMYALCILAGRTYRVRGSVLTEGA